jgi:L-iditol 2-dehydrogenase
VKVAAITGKRKAEIVDRPNPRIKKDFVRVKILVAPMCTEYHLYEQGRATDVLGHEAAGEVVETAQPGKVEIGQRVIVMPQYPCGECELCLQGYYIHCQHNRDPLAECGSQTGSATFAQYCIKQDWLLIPIPDHMSYEHGSMLCCGLGPTFGAMQKLQVDAFDTVLINGLGPVGQGGIINAVFRGARAIGVDMNAYRRDLALKLGAEAVIDPRDSDALDQVKSLTSGQGADKAVECTAVPEGKRFVLEAIKVLGKAAFVGWTGSLEWECMVPKGITLFGNWHWNLGDADRFLQVVGGSGELLDTVITHRFPMSRIQEAWELQLAGECGKILLYPWE